MAVSAKTRSHIGIAGTQDGTSVTVSPPLGQILTFSGATYTSASPLRVTLNQGRGMIIEDQVCIGFNIV